MYLEGALCKGSLTLHFRLCTWHYVKTQRFWGACQSHYNFLC